MLTTDADIARIESHAFIEAQHAGQRLSRGSASISGSTLTGLGVDVPFDAAGIAPGHVCVVDGQTYEVVERTGPSTLVISRVRRGAQDAPQPPSPVTNRPLHIVSFVPQRGIAHAQVMRSIGIEPDLPPDARAGLPGVESILNPGSLARLEALAALRLIWLSASLNAGADAGVSMRADRYREMYEQERVGIGAFLDLDGDGLPDAIRRPGVMQLTRA
ncbi:MAG: hypothetical protein KIT19_07095 [Phycisphaeraceae bacterium]|nr:hypothetical protein [Phycisphaeraceae bacterium]